MKLANGVRGSKQQSESTRFVHVLKADSGKPNFNSVSVDLACWVSSSLANHHSSHDDGTVFLIRTLKTLLSEASDKQIENSHLGSNSNHVHDDQLKHFHREW